MRGKSTNHCLPAVFAVAAFLSIPSVIAAPVLPGYVTDPTAVKDALEKDESYQPPERLKYPYISTYYVKPTVKAGDAVKVGFFVTDFESSLIRFLDDSHRFTAHLEYRPRGGSSKILTLSGLRSGDAEFDLGKLPAGEYEMRVWAVDAKGRESHRVIHDFRIVDPAALEIPADKIYAMTASDLAAYGIRNDGDVERISFGSCAVSGNGSLVDVGDLRPIRFPANADPATNPDNQSGAIVVRDCTFDPGIAKAISISGYRNDASAKKITVEASGNTFSEASGTIIADAPATWVVVP